MTKTFLIASVAALAIIVPAQAERGKGGGNDQQRAERPEKSQAQAREPRAERAQGRRRCASNAPSAHRNPRAPRRAVVERAKARQRIERRQLAFRHRVRWKGIERAPSWTIAAMPRSAGSRRSRSRSGGSASSTARAQR